MAISRMSDQSTQHSIIQLLTCYGSAEVNSMTVSGLCSDASNMLAEIVGRVWAGAGGNGMYYGSLNLVSVNTLEQECPIYLCLTYVA